MNYTATSSFIKQMDNPWLKNQVETHLFFGKYRGKYLYLLLVVVYILALNEILNPSIPFLSKEDFIGPESGFLVATIAAILFYKYEVSAFFLCIFKVLLLIFFFILVLGGIVNTLAGEQNAYLMILLGFVWLPSVEFIKSITTYQKYITLVRVAITVPTYCYL